MAVIPHDIGGAVVAMASLPAVTMGVMRAVAVHHMAPVVVAMMVVVTAIVVSAALVPAIVMTAVMMIVVTTSLAALVVVAMTRGSKGEATTDTKRDSEKQATEKLHDGLLQISVIPQQCDR